jgi:hypothetical protein
LPGDFAETEDGTEIVNLFPGGCAWLFAGTDVIVRPRKKTSEKGVSVQVLHELAEEAAANARRTYR